MPIGNRGSLYSEGGIDLGLIRFGFVPIGIAAAVIAGLMGMGGSSDLYVTGDKNCIIVPGCPAEREDGRAGMLPAGGRAGEAGSRDSLAS